VATSKINYVGTLQRPNERPENVELILDKRSPVNLINIIAVGDTTPSVKSNENNEIYKTANTGSTTITDFDDGFIGQIINVIIGDANTTIDFTGTNLTTYQNADWVPISGDYMRCIYDGASWFCVPWVRSLFGVEGPSSTIRQVDTDAATDEKVYDFLVASGKWQLRTLNDALSVADIVMEVNRTGNVVDNVTFPTRVIISNTAGADLLISDPAPFMVFVETGVSVDEGRWATFVDAEVWHFGPQTDAGIVTDAITVTRTLGVADRITLKADTIALEADVTKADLGTGAYVLDGKGAVRPVGFNVLPYISQAVALTVSLSDVGMRFNSATAGPDFDFTFPNDTDIPIGATWVIVNQNTADTRRVKGASGVLIRFFNGSSADAVTGGTGYTLATGAVATISKATDTAYHMWGVGITVT